MNNQNNNGMNNMGTSFGNMANGSQVGAMNTDNNIGQINSNMNSVMQSQVNSMSQSQMSSMQPQINQGQTGMISNYNSDPQQLNNNMIQQSQQPNTFGNMQQNINSNMNNQGVMTNNVNIGQSTMNSNIMQNNMGQPQQPINQNNQNLGNGMQQQSSKPQKNKKSIIVAFIIILAVVIIALSILLILKNREVNSLNNNINEYEEDNNNVNNVNDTVVPELTKINFSGYEFTEIPGFQYEINGNKLIVGNDSYGFLLEVLYGDFNNFKDSSYVENFKNNLIGAGYTVGNIGVETIKNKEGFLVEVSLANDNCIYYYTEGENNLIFAVVILNSDNDYARYGVELALTIIENASYVGNTASDFSNNDLMINADFNKIKEKIGQ